MQIPWNSQPLHVFSLGSREWLSLTKSRFSCRYRLLPIRPVHEWSNVLDHNRSIFLCLSSWVHRLSVRSWWVCHVMQLLLEWKFHGAFANNTIFPLDVAFQFFSCDYRKRGSKRLYLTSTISHKLFRVTSRSCTTTPAGFSFDERELKASNFNCLTFRSIHTLPVRLAQVRWILLSVSKECLQEMEKSGVILQEKVQWVSTKHTFL